jgi:DNA-binding NarL/FixJ family response regulator
MSTPLQATRNPQSRARILIVDDHMVRERLAEIINRECDLIVCGEAEDRHQAIEAIKTCPPELVIVDLTLKNSDGLELIKDIRSRWPKLAVLVVSMHDESLYAERCLRAGAQGYITKQEATRNILLAIRCVLSGNIYLNERISTQILSRLTAQPNAASATPTDLLADRELQVFELTGRGLNTRQIAQSLRLSPKTVETYRGRIREKLQVKDTMALLQMAISWVHKD